MNTSNQKIGFWAVLSLVVGSQIGSAVFMLPANLASFGKYAFYGWITSSLGAISLALVFANLAMHFPKTGGPHAYINAVFGKNLAFFVGWTYWVVSWVSSTAVIITAIGYITPFLGAHSPLFYFALQTFLLLAIAVLNLSGVSFAGVAETFFSGLKLIPLLVIPVFAIIKFDIQNITLSPGLVNHNIFDLVGQTTLLTLWGFIGLESATTPAGSVKNPKKTIPKAVIIGTILVAGIYIFNNIAISGLIPAAELANSKAPYADATKMIFSGDWHLVIAITATIVCIGTLNAWVLTSGQIAYGLAQDKFLPNFFSKTNKKGAPYRSIIMSSIGIIPLLYFNSDESIAEQVLQIIDYSVTSFLFIYVLCCSANLFVAWREKSLTQILVSIFSLIFCIWALSKVGLTTILISSLFTISGIPTYLTFFKKKSLAK